MEYASEICEEICNNKFVQHVGYSDGQAYADQCGPSCEQKMFSPENIDQMSRKITQLLQGVDEKNRKIVVPKDTICSILSNINDNYRPEIGCIYSRFTQPGSGSGNETQNIINQAINVIVSDVKVNMGMDQSNSQLSIWTTVLGDFNEHNLRSHSKIKLREKRPQPMMFNMTY
jgi:hypothetical protein